MVVDQCLLMPPTLFLLDSIERRIVGHREWRDSARCETRPVHGSEDCFPHQEDTLEISAMNKASC
jgi:hypothetical protein